MMTLRLRVQKFYLTKIEKSRSICLKIELRSYIDSEKLRRKSFYLVIGESKSCIMQRSLHRLNFSHNPLQCSINEKCRFEFIILIQFLLSLTAWFFYQLSTV